MLTHSSQDIRIFQLLHFLRLHQVVYQFTLICVVLFFHPQTRFFSLLTAFILMLLITPTFLLLQDVLGKKDDDIVNQKRLLFSESSNKIFFHSSFGFMIFLLVLTNFFSVLCFIGLFIATIGYGSAKKYRLMLTSYAGRWLSSVCTFLLYIFILVGAFINQLFYVALFISLFDLVGNIAGDLRDTEKDSNAGVKTFVTYYGEIGAVNKMIYLEIIAFALLLVGYNNLNVIAVFMFNILLFDLMGFIPDLWKHGLFHITKLLNYLLITLIICHVPLIIFIGVVVFVILTWFTAYYFYLFDRAPRQSIVRQFLIFKHKIS